MLSRESEFEAVADELKINWKTMREKAGPYPPQAFEFVRGGLAHTVELVHGERAAREATEDESRHVSGQQLCFGLKDFAVKQYGMLARTVLERWGVQGTEDFGRIVFAMIDAGLMRKTDEDSMDDFRSVYDFDEAFAALALPSELRH
ncbi:MAG: hypothetical protein KF866_11775 [Phycisphaeraceae bacterium]|nr:hypothetical protein [Phycisphaeraceae bacterium]MCW5755213.1 hypothetical protein [Phycisphaeraceae bacterium]